MSQPICSSRIDAGIEPKGENRLIQWDMAPPLTRDSRPKGGKCGSIARKVMVVSRPIDGPEMWADGRGEAAMDINRRGFVKLSGASLAVSSIGALGFGTS